MNDATDNLEVTQEISSCPKIAWGVLILWLAWSIFSHLWTLSSLDIYESKCRNSDGSNGVIAAHTQSFYWNWQNIRQCNIKSTQIKSFSNQQFQLYQGGYYLILALDLLYINTKKDFKIHPPSTSKPFQSLPQHDHHPSNVLSIRSREMFDAVELTKTTNR